MNYTTVFFILFCIFCTLWMFSHYACLLLALLLSLSLDVHAIWRSVLVIYFCKIRRRFKPKRLTDSNIFKVLCLPTDVDLSLQLTHGRLLRECFFGQTEFWVENYVIDALKKVNGTIRINGYHVTYDHPIKVFETFKIVAKILYWDDSTFYLKQTVIRNHDKRECATILSSHKLFGLTSSLLLDVLEKDLAKNRPVQTDLIRKFKEINTDMSKKL